MDKGSLLKKRYSIIKRIGRGAMGEVYQARDGLTGQIVAVKVIAHHLALDPEMLTRFQREGEALRQLQHPNIVSFIDAFQQGDQYVIVMEYVPGGNLKDLLKSGPLPVERARQIALDVCDALIRAHRLNIVHRDIKPENILLTADGSPKLTDFGVARLASAGAKLTGTGIQVGTPYYMAPEAWEGRPLDGRADLWSLGVVLYQMLAGQVPFGGDSAAVIMQRILMTAPPRLRDLRPRVPEGMAEIVTVLLTRDLRDRYQTARQLAADLEAGHPSTDIRRRIRPERAFESSPKARVDTDHRNREGVRPAARISRSEPSRRDMIEERSSTRPNRRGAPPVGGVRELAQRIRRSPLVVGGLGMLLTTCLLGFVFMKVEIPRGAATAAPTIQPSTAYVQFVHGGGQATYITNRMSRPESLVDGMFVDSGIGSIIHTESATSVKLFLTQALVVWLGPDSELEIRELASKQTGGSHTEVKLINGIMLTILAEELPAGETFRVIGDPGHVAQVLGSVMGVRYDQNFQTFDVDCLEGHCVMDGASLSACEWTRSESDLVPGPAEYADQSWYTFVDEKLGTECVPTATPLNAPTSVPTRTPKATVPAATPSRRTATPVVGSTVPATETSRPISSGPTNTPVIVILPTNTPRPRTNTPAPSPTRPIVYNTSTPATPSWPTATPSSSPSACSDGFDNDGDGKVDMADPGCYGPMDNDEADPPPPMTDTPEPLSPTDTPPPPPTDPPPSNTPAP